MVATQSAAGAAVAVATYVVAKRLPAFSSDPRTQAAIVAAAGLAVTLASIKVPHPMAKTAMVGAGVGLMARAASDAFPQLG